MPDVDRTATPNCSASRLRRMPSVSDICWQAIPLAKASNSVGKRGGLSPRNRSRAGPGSHRVRRRSQCPSSRSREDVVTVFTSDVRRAPMMATGTRGEFGAAICVTATSQDLPFSINTRRSLTIPPIHRVAGSPSQRPFQVEPEGRLGFERKTNRNTSAPHGCDRIVVAAMFKPRGAYATAFKLCRCRFLTVKCFSKYNFNTKGL